MNQVFVSNHMAGISDNSHVLWSTLAHTTGASGGEATCMVGVWDPIGQTFLDGSTAALSLISMQNLTSAAAALANATWVKSASGLTVLADATDLTGAGGIVNVKPSSPQWLNNQFQFVQAMPSGNPIASPIIHTNQVKRLSWTPNVEPVLHVITCPDSLVSSIASGDIITFVVSCKFQGAIEFYEAQVNPSGSVTSVTPAIGAAFDNPQRVYRFEYTATGSTVATEVNAAVDALIADTDHPINQLATVTESSDDLVLTAKFFGQVLKATILKNGDKQGVNVETTPMKMGVGSYAEVISAEKKAQYSQGHFNRMYLPTGGTTMASATAGGISADFTATYDRLVISYENANGTMPGFNGQGNTGTATLYVPNATYAAVATGRGVEATFGLGPDASANNIEYTW